jgi:hypothetical protein
MGIAKIGEWEVIMIKAPRGGHIAQSIMVIESDLGCTNNTHHTHTQFFFPSKNLSKQETLHNLNIKQQRQQVEGKETHQGGP